MSWKLAIVFSLMSLPFLISCKSDDGSSTTCNFYEEHFHDSTTMTYTLGQKAAQRFNITNGFKLKKITLEMHVLNSDTITLSVYKAVNGQTTPAGGNLLGQSTIQSDLVANTGKIEFPFSGSPFLGGENYDYYLILEATGGDFEVTVQSASWFDLYGEIWTYSASTWTKNVNYDFSFALSGDCGR